MEHLVKIPRKVLTEVVYERLLESLLDQDIQPGSRINADHLRETLGVSITPLREALARLESDGLVQNIPHKGYVVARLLDASGFESLYEAREILEPAAVQLAALRRTPEELAHIRVALSATHDATTGKQYKEFGEFARADTDFHRALAIASHNPNIIDAIDRLRAHMHLSRLYSGRGVVDSREALVEHDAIAAAVNDGDAVRAGELMKTHIGGSRTRLRQFLEDQEQEQPRP